jgi:hypothetical protein
VDSRSQVPGQRQGFRGGPSSERYAAPVVSMVFPSSCVNSDLGAVGVDT